MSFSKYIIIDNGGVEVPIVFDEILSHKEMSYNKTVISAGFLDVWENEVSVFGESVTLNIKSRKEDAILIKKMLIHEDF